MPRINKRKIYDFSEQESENVQDPSDNYPVAPDISDGRTSTQKKFASQISRSGKQGKSKPTGQLFFASEALQKAGRPVSPLTSELVKLGPGEGSQSLKPKNKMVDGSQSRKTLDNPGEGSQSRKPPKNTVDGSQSRKTVNNPGEGSQSRKPSKNIVDGSQSRKTQYTPNVGSMSHSSQQKESFMTPTLRSFPPDPPASHRVSEESTSGELMEKSHHTVILNMDLPKLTGQCLTHRTLKGFWDKLRDLDRKNIDYDRYDLIDPSLCETITKTLMYMQVDEYVSWPQWSNEHLFTTLLTYVKDTNTTQGGGVTHALKKIRLNIKVISDSQWVHQFIGEVNNIVRKHDIMKLENLNSEEHTEVLSNWKEKLFLNSDYPPYTEYLANRIWSQKPKTLDEFLSYLFQAVMQTMETINFSLQLGANFEKKKSLAEKGDPSTDKNREKPTKKYKGNPSKENKKAITICNGCGKTHYSECWFKKHPDYNTEDKPFLESKKGLKYQKLGESTLDKFKQLNGDKLVAYKPTQVNDIFTDTISPTTESTLSLYFRDKERKHTVLIDTGAAGGNYVDSSIVEKFNLFSCNCKNKLICFASTCTNSNKCISTPVTLQNTYTELTTTLEARVVKGLPYDAIIGLPSIRKLNIFSIFPELVSELKSSHHSKKQCIDQDVRANISHTDRPVHVYMNEVQNNTVPKDVLLDREDDTDHIDEFIPPSPWEREPVDFDEIIDSIKIVGTPEFRQKCKNLIYAYKDRFALELQSDPAYIKPLILEVNVADWHKPTNSRPPRLQTIAKQYEINKFISKAIANNIIESSQSEYWSQVLLTPKPNGSYRFCLDYRLLNQCSKGMGWPIPNIELMLQRIGSKKPHFFAKLDLTSGYHQAPIHEDSRDFTAFRTHSGVYRWTRVPMGLKGAPGYFQHAMATQVLGDYIYDICELYLDDINTWGQTEEELLQNLEKILLRLREKNITLNPAKCELGMTEIEFVGHTISKEGLSFSKDKRDKVLTFRKPVTQKHMKSFLGLGAQFRKHVQDYANIAKPLQDCIKPYVPSKKIKWDERLEAAFELLQTSINECPTLYFLHNKGEILLNTDASDYGIGAYLHQIVEEIDYPVAFVSHTLTKTEINWSTIEKESYAIFYALQKLSHLLRDVHFTLKTDHKNITFVNTDHRQKVKRWKIAIQGFDFDIEHVAGRDNPIADGFSRLCQPEIETVNVDEDLTTYKQHYEDMSKVHNSRAGHFGVEPTLQKLTQNGKSWPEMRKDVRRFIRKCPCCQKMSALKVAIETHPFTTASYSIMDRVCIDAIGPLPEDELGNKYVITLIDAFSRFVLLISAKDTTAESAAQAILQWLGIFGIPSSIVSDNGTQFRNSLIQQLCSIAKIDHNMIHAYSKEENSIVERANKEVMRHLRAIIFDEIIKAKAFKYLPLVNRIINAQVHSSIGVSPAQIVFGNTLQLDRGIIFPHKNLDPSSTTYRTWIQDMLQVQSRIIQIAVDNQIETDKFHIQQRQIKNQTIFDINSYVLVEYENKQTPTKLHLRSKGPYRVVNKIGNIYTLQNIVTNKIEDYHVKLLRPFHYDPAITDPMDVARRDEEYHVIQQVLNHRFKDNKQTRTSLEFHIKWAGDKEPDWYTWSADYAKNQVIQQYMKTNKLSRFLSKRYKHDN